MIALLILCRSRPLSNKNSTRAPDLGSDRKFEALYLLLCFHPGILGHGQEATTNLESVATMLSRSMAMASLTVEKVMYPSQCIIQSSRLIFLLSDCVGAS